MSDIGKNGGTVKENIKYVDNQVLCQLAITSLPVAVFIVDSELKIIGFNAQEITGYSSKEALGSYCGEI